MQLLKAVIKPYLTEKLIVIGGALLAQRLKEEVALVGSYLLDKVYVYWIEAKRRFLRHCSGKGYADSAIVGYQLLNINASFLYTGREVAAALVSFGDSSLDV